MPDFFDDFFNLLLVVFYFFPIVHVYFSPRSYNKGKLGWLIAVFLFSWLGYIVFLASTQTVSESDRGEEGW